MIRKAIRLTWQDPQYNNHRKLADQLLGVHRNAKKLNADKRLLDLTRRLRVAELDDQLLELRVPRWIGAAAAALELKMIIVVRIMNLCD